MFNKLRQELITAVPIRFRLESKLLRFLATLHRTINFTAQPNVLFQIILSRSNSFEGAV